MTRKKHPVHFKLGVIPLYAIVTIYTDKDTINTFENNNSDVSSPTEITQESLW